MSDRQQRMLKFLRNNPVGVLSTVTPDGNPHGVVVYFQVNEDFEVSFLTKTETRKYDNLMHNNHLMLTVFDPKTQSVVQVTGRAKECTDIPQVLSIAGKIFDTNRKVSEANFAPISKLDAGKYALMQITPVQVRMAVYGKAEPGSYEEMFESIESFALKDVY